MIGVTAAMMASNGCSSGQILKYNGSAGACAAIEAADVTLYRTARDAEVDWGTIQRFLDGSRPNIRIDTVDKLCESLGLELRPKRRKAGK